MGAVKARNITASAADASLSLQRGMDDIVAIQFLGRNDVLIGEPHEIGEVLHTMVFQVVHEPVLHILDDAVALNVVSGCHLQCRGSEQNEFQSVLSGLDTSDAGNGQSGNALAQLLYKAQRNGFDGLAGVSRN